MNTRVALISMAAVVAAAVMIPRGESADSPDLKKAPTLEGTWRWNFVMPDGTTNRPKLRFTVDEGQLTGKTSFRSGNETTVTNLSVTGDQVSFQVVRRRNDRDVVTTYTGKWNDQAIKGKIESDWAGEKQSFDWEATRAHHGVEGIWRWTNSFFGGGGGGRGTWAGRPRSWFRKSRGAGAGGRADYREDGVLPRPDGIRGDNERLLHQRRHLLRD